MNQSDECVTGAHWLLKDREGTSFVGLAEVVLRGYIYIFRSNQEGKQQGGR